MTIHNKKEQDVNPSKLDELADQKYAASFRGKTDLLNREAELHNEAEKQDFGPSDDGAGSAGEEGVINDNTDNVGEQEAESLDEAASRMPEEDDILDQGFLDGEDGDGTLLNESDEPLGEDLDISPEDENANIYDDNE